MKRNRQRQYMTVASVLVMFFSSGLLWAQDSDSVLRNQAGATGLDPRGPGSESRACGGTQAMGSRHESDYTGAVIG